MNYTIIDSNMKIRREVKKVGKSDNKDSYDNDKDKDKDKTLGKVSKKKKKRNNKSKKLK